MIKHIGINKTIIFVINVDGYTSYQKHNELYCPIFRKKKKDMYLSI